MKFLGSLGLILFLAACVDGALQEGPPIVYEVRSITPQGGPLAGGQVITLLGDKFNPGITVDIGGVACTPVVNVSSSEMTCTTGANAAGTYTVTVTDVTNGILSLPNAYSYNAAPTVVSVLPVDGPLAGGTAITITGTGFYAGATATVGGNNCTGLVVVNATTITCTTAAHAAGAEDIVVTNADTQTDTLVGAYTYQAAPTVTSVAPAFGPITGNTPISITGTGFLAGASVTVGGNLCSAINVVSPTQIDCDTPVHTAGAKNVVVTNTDTQTGTLTNGYTYLNTPTITSVTANVGSSAGGTNVTIAGTNFYTGATVDFGGSACTAVTVVSSTSITCTTAAHAAGIVAVTVTNVDAQFATQAGGFTYLDAPTVTLVAPAAGFALGGTAVTLTGTNFYAGATVSFGGSACTSVTVVGPTTITCTTAAHADGLVNVVVTNIDTQTGTGVGLYTYQAAPTVASVLPVGGPTVGGTAISITGNYFQVGATVTVGGVACTAPTTVSPTQIDCTTGAHASGLTNIVVTNPDTQTGTGLLLYSYNPSPVIASVLPNLGPTAGGENIVITGVDFLSGVTVDLGGSPCTVTGNTSTTINCTTTAHAAAGVTLTVTNPDAQFDVQALGYFYLAAPVVTSILPVTGDSAGGTAVTITGTDFFPGADVVIGGATCTAINVVSSTQIDCVTDANTAGLVDVTVTNADTQASTLPNSYTYLDAPSVTSIAPTAGALAGGTAVTITGTAFVAGATVDINGSACTGVTVVSATSITCTTGASAAGTYDVNVTNPDTQVGTGVALYTYQAAPTVTSVLPVAGALAGGTAITITGTGFLTGATATVGGVTCTGLTVVSATSITCTTGAHAAANVDIIVTNTDTQNGTGVGLFTYQAAPTVTSVAPNAGALAGGTAVTITGTGFIAGATVSFAGAACTGITVVGPTTITCTTGAHAAGLINVNVTNVDTQAGTGVGVYTYQAAPTVTSVAPNGGLLAGGTAVTITGTGFLAGATVDFGGSACAGITVVSSTQITCTTAAHAAGAVTVTVTNTDTQTGNLATAYTYRNAPTVTLVAPVAGALAGGTAITITGTGFVAGATVTLGGVACTGVTVVSATSITCTSVAHAAGLVNAIVTNTDTQNGTGVGLYTYQAAPTVTSVSPNIGPLAGAQAVTVTGTGFIAGATVAFTGNACTGITVVSPTQITCTTPAHTAGFKNIVVTNTDGQLGVLASGYNYVAAPTVTSVLPVGGNTAGGTAVTITGTGFLTGATVDFGGAGCTGVTVVSATSITCTTAAHAAGAVAITVTNTDTQNGNLAAAYTYALPPVITATSPLVGPLAGGGTLTIDGTDFVSGATVTVGGAACTGVIFISAIQLTCTLPAGSGASNVVVTNPDGQTDTEVAGHTYNPAPTVTSVSPNGGALAGGTAVTITGTNFFAGATVDFGGSACGGITVVSPTQMTCTTAAHAAGAVTVAVTNVDTQTGSLVTAYTYQNAPTVTNVTPTAGALAGGTAITVTGTDFVAGATVTLGGVACTGVTVLSPTSITCTSGAHVAGAVTAVVTNTDTQSGNLVAAYVYQPSPTVTSVTPASSPLAGGLTVSITGTGFVAGATATINGVACTAPNVISATQLDCTTPARAAGTYNIVVTNVDGQSGTGVNLITYQPAPTVTSVAPSAGALAGGTAVTITGTNFITGATVDFGGSACTGVTVVSATSITCTTAAHAAGAVNVVVTNADAQFGTGVGLYTYQVAPTITSIAPNGGVLAGGTFVTITGTGYLAGATVSIGAFPCAGITIVSPTQITCTTPANLAGAYDLVVSNSDGQSATSVAAYTYRPAPTVLAVAPSTQALGGGGLITITGTGFVTGASADINGSVCSGVTVVNATTITCTAPANPAGTYDIIVTNTDTQTGTGTSLITYQGAPTITAVAPVGGNTAGGTSVTITGTNFAAGASVDVGGSACTGIVVVNATTITCITPAHAAGAVNIMVTNADTQNGTGVGLYTYAAPPSVSSILPVSGTLAGGTSVTITGTDFVAGATVSIGGSACSVTAETPPTSITCTSGVNTAGNKNVVVTNPDTQPGTLTNGYQYISMAILEWQVGGASPNPPNPDNYGTTAANVSHTYTLRNIGDATTSTISVYLTGAEPAAWFINTDNCSGAGNELPSMSSCTVTIIFLGAFLAPASPFSATLRAEAVTGGTSDNDVQGATP
ncbi:MAG: IPT/TIG domain-containing protein [Bacteriovoracaceae bacterium]|nr:IPT/TIG domain-containing protein [Bacteriovoracaceae bacterium]